MSMSRTALMLICGAATPFLIAAKPDAWFALLLAISLLISWPFLSQQINH